MTSELFYESRENFDKLGEREYNNMLEELHTAAKAKKTIENREKVRMQKKKQWK